MAPQEVEEATASAIHLVAQAGIWPATRVARAERATAKYVVFILKVETFVKSTKRVLGKESWFVKTIVECLDNFVREMEMLEFWKGEGKPERDYIDLYLTLACGCGNRVA